MPRRRQNIDPERQKWFEDLKKRDEIGMVDPVAKALANYAPIASTPGRAFKVAAAADQLGLGPNTPEGMMQGVIPTQKNIKDFMKKVEDETQRLLKEGFSPAVAEALGYLKVRRPSLTQRAQIFEGELPPTSEGTVLGKHTVLPIGHAVDDLRAHSALPAVQRYLGQLDPLHPTRYAQTPLEPRAQWSDVRQIYDLNRPAPIQGRSTVDIFSPQIQQFAPTATSTPRAAARTMHEILVHELGHAQHTRRDPKTFNKGDTDSVEAVAEAAQALGLRDWSRFQALKSGNTPKDNFTSSLVLPVQYDPLNPPRLRSLMTKARKKRERGRD